MAFYCTVIRCNGVKVKPNKLDNFLHIPLIMWLRRLVLIWFGIITGLQCRPYHDPQCKPGRDVIVQLFDWKWDNIKRECVDFLGPNGFCGVQVSPPEECAVITNPNRPWWERYQPVSYELISRSGNEQDFRDMVETCNSAGVRIYVDAVINHMTGKLSGVGTAGHHFDGNTRSFPAVPYTTADFNGPDNCNTSDGQIHNYDDRFEARNCDLFGLNDLRFSKEYVRTNVAGYLNKMVDIGVAGFRIDAGRHMWPGDLENIFGRLHDLPTKYFNPQSRPFVVPEIIELKNSASDITAAEYLNVGRVTNFMYGIELANIFLHKTQSAEYLSNLETHFGMAKSDDSVVFLYNHDTERDSLKPIVPITFRDPRQLKMATAFMLAYPYGLPRIMSSFSWDRKIGADGTDENYWVGPPHNDDMSIKDVQTQANGSCNDRWVCEHRWRVIHNMVGFRNSVAGTAVRWHRNTYNQIVFSRGNKGFIAIVNDDSVLDDVFDSGLPPGGYCDIISGGVADDGGCTGKTFVIRSDYHLDIFINGTSEEPMIALHIDKMSETVTGPTVATLNDQEYFKSYGDLEVHKLMLKDKPRTLAYKDFIEKNSDLIKGKVVLDVGAGSGILSLFAAKAGAKKVYAVEASEIADVCEEIVQMNNYENVIHVVKGAVESVDLPDQDQVDVIISEWMGFYLLHESMLDSVLFARDKWLKKDGIILPSYCTVFVSPVDMTDYRKETFDYWKEVYGFDFSPFQNYTLLESLKQPAVTYLKEEQCLSKPEVFTEFDMKTVKLSDIQELEEKLAFDIEKDSPLHGFAFWFDVDFNPIVEGSANPEHYTNNSSYDVKNLTLSTSPTAEHTHWKQTVVFLPANFAVTKNETIFCKVSLSQDNQNKRHYNISLELRESLEDTDDEDYDEEEEEDTSSHPMPCDCGSVKCQLIRAIMEKYESEQTELEMEAEFTDITAEVQAAQTIDKDTSYLDPESLTNDDSSAKDEEGSTS